MYETRPPLPVGSRVRHYGQQYPSARTRGTGNIAAIHGPYRDGSWEYLIYHDTNGFNGGPSWWSSLSTYPTHEEGWPVTTPKRVQRKRARDWRMPEGAKYVGRPGRYGNPFKVGALVMDPGPYASPACPYEGFMEPGVYQGTGLDGPYNYEIRHVRDAADAVALFTPYVTFHDDAYPPEAIRKELGGRDLACWCKVGDPCHGDEWIRLANGDPDA